MHLFLFEHWRMTVCVNNIKSNYSSGGKDWVSVIFGFENNFILLYSLKQIKDDILEMLLFCTVAVFVLGFFYNSVCVQIDKSHSHHSQNILREWAEPICHWVVLMQSWVRLASVKLSARWFLSWACLAGLCLKPTAAQASNLQKKWG